MKFKIILKEIFKNKHYKLDDFIYYLKKWIRVRLRIETAYYVYIKSAREEYDEYEIYCDNCNSNYDSYLEDINGIKEHMKYCPYCGIKLIFRKEK